MWYTQGVMPFITDSISAWFHKGFGIVHGIFKVGGSHTIFPSNPITHR
jgi:hypothetical protein